MRATFRKWGNSLAVRIPKPFAAELGIEEGTVVELALDLGKLVITPVTRRQFKLRGLLRGVTRRNVHGEVKSGSAAGREAW